MRSGVRVVPPLGELLVWRGRPYAIRRVVLQDGECCYGSSSPAKGHSTMVGITANQNI